MLPRFKPSFGTREICAAVTPAASAAVENFELQFARVMGQQHAIAFPYGRTALLYLLKALGLRGAEILCPAYTCIVVAHAIVLSGNEPVFIDSSGDDFNMDLERAQEAITERTRAVIATSIFGYPVNLDKLRILQARNPDLIIIHDCAHSFGAAYNGASVHQSGLAAVFGLNISKLISSVFGGMITTDSFELATKLRELRDAELSSASLMRSLYIRFYLLASMAAFSTLGYSATSNLRNYGLLTRFEQYYTDDKIDMPTDYLEAMTPIQGVIGSIQLGRYGRIVEQRRMLASAYNDLLQGTPHIRLPPIIAGATYSHYVLRSELRDSIREKCLKRGIELGTIIDYSVPELSAYQKRSGRRFDCPVARRLSSTCFNLPVGFQVDPELVSETLHSVLRELSASERRD